MQRMIQLTEDQKAAICMQRRAYIVRMARIAHRRQRLLQQLQQAPAVKLNTCQLESSCDAEENIVQQLQSCTLEENMLYVELLGNVGRGVGLPPYPFPSLAPPHQDLSLKTHNQLLQ